MRREEAKWRGNGEKGGREGGREGEEGREMRNGSWRKEKEGGGKIVVLSKSSSDTPSHILTSSHTPSHPYLPWRQS